MAWGYGSGYGAWRTERILEKLNPHIWLSELICELGPAREAPVVNAYKWIHEDWQKKKKVNRKQLYKIGIAGFCFSNIMMLSFPEYLSDQVVDLGNLRPFFIYLNLILSLPVLLYSASDFFISAYTGLRQKWLNIDAPIALAISLVVRPSTSHITRAVL